MKKVQKVFMIIAKMCSLIAILLGGTIAIINVIYLIRGDSATSFGIVENIYWISFLIVCLLINKIILEVYIVLTIIFIIGGLTISVLNMKKKKGKRITCIFFLVALIGFIYYLFVYSHYHIPVNFKKGTQYMIVEEAFGVDAIHKNMLNQGEFPGSTYIIKGWQSNNTLIYTRNDGSGPYTYSYNIYTKRSNKGKTNDRISKIVCTYEECVHPYEKSQFSEKIENAYYSFDKKYIAVIYKQIFGPEDIVIIKR